MNDEQQFVQMVAECIRGEHGTAARLAAGSGYVYSGLLGTVIPAFRRLVDDLDEEITTQRELEVMDMMTLPLWRNRQRY